MDATAILNELHGLGVKVCLNGQKLQMEPGSLVPPDLLAEVRQHKAEIINELQPLLDRPPETEQELRRLTDHLADPEEFDRWLAWAMTTFDPAESQTDGEESGC